MALSINYSEEKNQLLKVIRGICFEDVIPVLREGKLLADKLYSVTKFKHQRLYVIQIGDYVYVVPYVKNIMKSEIFLQNIYPSQVLDKMYVRRKEHENIKK